MHIFRPFTISVTFRLLVRVVACCLLALPASAALAERVSVAVASNFVVPMRAVITAFGRQQAADIQLSIGSSGKFYAQIKHGAPFDLFLSADQAKPIALQQDGLALKHSRFTYAIGKLVLWSAYPQSTKIGAETLKTLDFERLALANPKLAPYGLAATQVLAQLGLLAPTRDSWVMGENVSQAFQFVHSKNADLGFVALSQLIHMPNASYWQIPDSFYQPIHQDAVLLTRAENNPIAQALMQFMQTDNVRELIQSFGYRVTE